LLSLSTSLPKSGFFRFERAWLRNQSFLPTVLAGWQQTHERADAAGHLASCIKSTRAAAKVWSRCIRAPNYLIPNYKFIIQLFDFFEETRPLSAHGFQAHRQTQETLQEQIKAKAAYWKQRSKQRAIKECDSNTAFHHAHATQRLRSNYIKMVRVDGQEVVSHDGKTAALTDFFKSIIGVPGDSVPSHLQHIYVDRSTPS